MQKGRCPFQELQHAVATSPEDDKFNATRLVPEATLMGLCRGLVVLEESRMVRLVHYTAKATLEQLLTGSFPYPHSVLATICMTHLADCGFSKCAFHPTVPTSGCFGCRSSLGLCSWCLGFPCSTNARVSASPTVKLHGSLQIVEVSLWIYITSTSFNHFMWSLFFRLPVTFARPCDVVHPNTATKLGGYTPLFLACLQEHQAGVQALLRLPSICVNTGSTRGWSPQMEAAFQGHEAIVELLLLSPGMDVNM
ncbi:hypothetical protein BKA70DRAFT_501467 [Coprinopsis sp. MPI-PUGE-AT-0042]|nr:hypothetical protein BKA70DRAFT_501467 [Coprinopsis sp. MPI-PUGE-AT-0042]